MSLALAIGLFAQFSAMETPVTLTDTKNVSALLEEVSSISGTRLIANKEKGKEILILSLNRVPLRDAMDQIAWATYGRWEKAGDGFRLVRNSDAEHAAERAYVRWQSKEAATLIAQVRDRILKKNIVPEMSPWILGQSGRTETSPPSPVEIALAQMLEQIKPETTIYLRPDQWAVYSDIGTPAQIPIDCRQILATYNAAVDGERASMAVHAVLSFAYRFEQAEANLRLYNADGDMVQSSRLNLKLYGAPGRPKEFADQIPAEMEVPLSEATRFYLRPALKENYFPDIELLQQVPDVLERIRNPEKYEPLATFTTDAWLGVARWQKRNLVANVDDWYMTPMWTYGKQPNLRTAFINANGYNAELKPGWLLARPSLANPPWRHRTDRASLGRLLRAKTIDNLSYLRAMADYAGNQTSDPDSFETNVFTHWTWTGNGGALGTGLPIYRLLGSLPVDQQQAWLERRPVPIASIPDVAKRILMSAVETGNSDLSDEPTVRFPLGLPQTGWLKSELSDTTEYHCLLPEDNYLTQMILNGVELGRVVRSLQKSNPEFLHKLKIQEFSRQSLRLYAVFPTEPKPHFIVTLDTPVVARAEILWENAPEEFRARILK